MAKKLNSRAVAAKLTWQIIDQGQSLDSAINIFFESSEYSPKDRGFIQELIYGVCRWYGDLDKVASQLLKSPIRNKDRVIHFVLLTGLYQLRHISTADHAAVAETVSACKQLNKVWAKNLINGCLRNYQRMDQTIPQDAFKVSHPEWIRDKIISAWPDHAATIFEANNQRPPMCLRVNTRQHSRQEYLDLLNNKEIPAKNDQYSQDGIILDHGVPVTALPGFDNGACSVQDTAAQLAADFLHTQANMTVLDACAAPGGKTAHLLERSDNKLNMHALDISERRAEQLHDTLGRLQLDADVYTADATNINSWPIPKTGYDRILIDAPCSGIGVIRRHPDIKHHRRPSDVEELNLIQSKILSTLWPTLKPGGFMLYMTCSILPSENEAQIRQFVGSVNNAMLTELNHPSGLTLEFGTQTLPGVHAMDGFFYSLLKKTDN